jgi:dUTP pyrophosphatase
MTINAMNIKIKRFNKELPLPKTHTDRAAAFDLYVRETTAIPAGGIAYVPLNNVIATPDGYFLLLAARSSMHKRGLMLANGIGIIDPDFSGDGDELKGVVYNFTHETVTVEKGDRLIQGTFIKVSDWSWEEVDSMSDQNRGAFGTTGK